MNMFVPLTINSLLDAYAIVDAFDDDCADCMPSNYSYFFPFLPPGMLRVNTRLLPYVVDAIYVTTHRHFATFPPTSLFSGMI